MMLEFLPNHSLLFDLADLRPSRGPHFCGRIDVTLAIDLEYYTLGANQMRMMRDGKSMRIVLAVLGAAGLAALNPAVAQYAVAPTPVIPGYAPAPTAPPQDWREQRGSQDWRNNTWREQQFDQNPRNNDWRQQRANEDWQQREQYEKQRTPNNATERGYGEKNETTQNKLENSNCDTAAGTEQNPCPKHAPPDVNPTEHAYGQ
jgi:hypothetical protein